MSTKKIIPVMYLKDGRIFYDKACSNMINDGDAVAVCEALSNKSADEIMIIELSYDDASHEEAINVIRRITKAIDTPIILGGNINRVEDVKKYLYAGAKLAMLDSSRESNMLMMKEVADRFGADKLALNLASYDEAAVNMALDHKLAFIYSESCDASLLENANEALNIVTSCGNMSANAKWLKSNSAYGLALYGDSYADYVDATTSLSLNSVKEEYTAQGIAMNTYTSSISFTEFKVNEAGLIPIIVQDYKTDEVLMLAYMNEEAFNMTVKTGIMTYYSRSREELWIKGETSGHYQFVKSIEIDCDNDTLLAKVKQVGAACHTGNRSCFYRNLIKTEYAETNPLKVFNDVFSVILDRKVNPKEGSYTNYLFDKGIDKILKKCGEEATEIVIAAKNPDPEEIKYEISDFLYHVMVLMAVKDISWDDIVKELANR